MALCLQATPKFRIQVTPEIQKLQIINRLLFDHAAMYCADLANPTVSSSAISNLQLFPISDRFNDTFKLTITFQAESAIPATVGATGESAMRRWLRGTT
jgi:hypothetical protein